MNVYHKNMKATLEGSSVVLGSALSNIYDPVLELRTDFKDKKITLYGNFGNIIAVDSICIGYTNADLFEFKSRHGTCSGKCRNKITIHNFDYTLRIEEFELTLEGIEPLYLGHLFTGQKTVLPRFVVSPVDGIELPSQLSRSFGGQAYGARRKTLEYFNAEFIRITNEEKKVIKQYIEEALNIEPHIIDPYGEVRDEYPPMYATLSISEMPFKKRPENGFYWDCSLSWKEAR